MHTNYDDPTQDPEQAWRDAQSSAGQHTQQLSGNWAMQRVAPGAHNRNNLIGIGLIGLGLLIPIMRLFPDRDAFNAGMILLIIASCFLFLAFWRRMYAFLIPGSILTGLSLGVPFAELTNGISILWGLALAFVSIFLLGRTLFGVERRWALIPAVPLFAVGLIIAVVNLPIFFASNLMLLPLLLIAAGLYLGWGRRTA